MVWGTLRERRAGEFLPPFFLVFCSFYFGLDKNLGTGSSMILGSISFFIFFIIVGPGANFFSFFYIHALSLCSRFIHFAQSVDCPAD